MNIASKLLLGSALMLSFAAPALAQSAVMPEGTTLQERNVYYFSPTGKMIRMQATDQTHAMVMKEFKPMAAGTMVYVSGGKVYFAQDRKMDDGTMMGAMLFPRVDLF